MLTQEDYWMIQELHQQGVYRGDIAERLGVHRKTVGRALERGGPPPASAVARGTPSSSPTGGQAARGVQRRGHLPRDPGPGIRGKIRVLRAYIEPRRALRPGRATVRFETEPAKHSMTGASESPGLPRESIGQRVGLLSALP